MSSTAIPIIKGAIISVSVSSGTPSKPINPNARVAGIKLGTIDITPACNEPSVTINNKLITTAAMAKLLN